MGLSHPAVRTVAPAVYPSRPACLTLVGQVNLELTPLSACFLISKISEFLHDATVNLYSLKRILGPHPGQLRPF